MKVKSDCGRAQGWFSPFLDQGLDPKKARVLVAHLRSCRVCAKKWEQFRLSLGGLKTLDRIEPSPDFEEKLWRRIRESEPEPRWGFLRGVMTSGALWPKLAGVAAVAAIVVGVLIAGGVLGPEGSRSPYPVAVERSRGSETGSVLLPVNRLASQPAAPLQGAADWNSPVWTPPRSGRLERGLSIMDGLPDTAVVDPEFVIRRVRYDPSAPPSRAF